MLRNLLLSVLLAVFFAPALCAQQSLRFAVHNTNASSIPPYWWYNHCELSHRGLIPEFYKRLARDME